MMAASLSASSGDDARTVPDGQGMTKQAGFIAEKLESGKTGGTGETIEGPRGGPVASVG